MHRQQRHEARHKPSPNLDDPRPSTIVAGVLISDRGHPTAAGVVCRCPEEWCPAHGRLGKGGRTRTGSKLVE